MGVLLVVAVMALAFLCGRLSVLVIRQNKTIDELSDRLAVVDHTVDGLVEDLADLGRDVRRSYSIGRGDE